MSGTLLPAPLPSLQHWEVSREERQDGLMEGTSEPDWPDLLLSSCANVAVKETESQFPHLKNEERMYTTGWVK